MVVVDVVYHKYDEFSHRLVKHFFFLRRRLRVKEKDPLGTLNGVLIYTIVLFCAINFSAIGFQILLWA